MKPSVRTIAVVVAAIIAVAVPAVQGLTEFGLSAGAFSRQGDSTLRVAGYAFSIWGPLYLGMIAYAAFQARPKAARSPVLAAFAWPSVIALAGCGLWIGAAALNLRWATVAIITASAAALIAAMLGAPKRATRGEYAFIVLPLSLLAGWLTIAAPVNLLTVLTMEGLIAPDAALRAGLLGVALTALGAVGVAFLARNAAYLAPVVWGFGGVIVAESARNAPLAHAAQAAIAVLLVAAAFIVWRRIRSPTPRAP